MAGPSQVALSVTATSQVSNSSKDPATPPQITMNGNPFPAPKNPPGTASGWQLVVINSSLDMTDPASIIFNNYLGLYPDSSGYWYDTYSWTYDAVGRFLLASGSPDDQLVFLANYGWDQNAPPTSFALDLMMRIGAGPELQKWALTTDRGSEAGWTSFPTAYVLVGGSSYQYGLGHEDYGFNGTSTATAQVSVTLGNP
jgi:hypothetical protein